MKDYDYSQNGAYFITICTKDRHELLGKIDVGSGVLDAPKIILSEYGAIIKEQIKTMSKFYDNISIYKYVVIYPL